jgi:hypothetical protein
MSLYPWQFGQTHRRAHLNDNQMSMSSPAEDPERCFTQCGYWLNKLGVGGYDL